tara:strand:- start:113 stop:628 length:516 start_codon:yes stop_codon:yes gene_type:complete
MVSKNIKKYFLFILLILLTLSCSKDNDLIEEESLTFLANNVGKWETTFTDLGVNVAIEITSTSTKTYSKLTSANCYNNASKQFSGTLSVETHTATKYTSLLSDVPVAEIFSGTDLDFLLSGGINYIDISSSYLSSGVNTIVFAEIYYEANTNNDVLSVQGNLGKINTIIKC